MSPTNIKNGVRIDIVSRNFARLLSEETRTRLHLFHLLYCLEQNHCILRYTDHGLRGRHPPIMPYAPFQRSRVYTGTRETGSWNVDSQLARFQGRYFYGFSNGRVDEDDAGQRILIAWSEDAIHWSEPVAVVGGEDGTRVCHKCVGLHATAETLYLLGRALDTTPAPELPGMRRFDRMLTHVYASADGSRWERVFTLDDRILGTYEAPRLTAEGRLMGVAAIKRGADREAASEVSGAPGHDNLTLGGSALLRWPGDQLCEQPAIVPIPQPFGAVFPGGEGSWYQTDEGTILVFWRDEGGSCRLWVNFSTDGGQTFGEPMISDIPDAMSRNYAGRLADGRYYLCSNAFPSLLNRGCLTLLLSDDGYEFNQAFLLVDDPTSMRRVGLLKEDGYMYPCCLPEKDRLLVGYSVNKEDIECGIVDLRRN